MKRAFLHGLLIALLTILALFGLSPEQVFADGRTPEMFAEWTKQDAAVFLLTFASLMSLGLWGYLSDYDASFRRLIGESFVSGVSTAIPLAVVLLFL